MIPRQIWKNVLLGANTMYKKLVNKMTSAHDYDSYFRASLGNTTSRGETLGQLDISSSILADLDGRVLADFMQEIGAEANEDVGRYFVDCKRAAGLPNLTITTGDVELSFSSKDYVDLVSCYDGMFDTFTCPSHLGKRQRWQVHRPFDQLARRLMELRKPSFRTILRRAQL